jgi:hypothetical protein
MDINDCRLFFDKINDSSVLKNSSCSDATVMEAVNRVRSVMASCVTHYRENGWNALMNTLLAEHGIFFKRGFMSMQIVAPRECPVFFPALARDVTVLFFLAQDPS